MDYRQLFQMDDASASRGGQHHLFDFGFLIFDFGLPDPLRLRGQSKIKNPKPKIEKMSLVR